MLFFFSKDTLSIEDEKLFKAYRPVRFVYFSEPLQVRYTHPNCENFNTLSQFSHSLLQEFLSYLAYMY